MDASNTDASGISPKIQVTENKDAVNVMAEIPGIDEKDIDVKVSSDGYRRRFPGNPLPKTDPW